MEEKKLNPITDTTKFVNIDKKPFDIYIDGKLARHLEASEEQVLPVFVAKVGAKHLIDRILQEDGVKDSMRLTPERDTLLAKIIPDVAEEIKVKPLSDEDFRKQIEKRVEKQDEDIKALGGKTEDIKDLQKQLKKLQTQLDKKELEKQPKK